MEEQVVPAWPGLEWEPNAPHAVLVQDDRGRACLALDPHFADPDQRVVVFIWSGCQRVVMGSPNDEGISRHRLFASGLDTLLWTGEVVNSSWLDEISPMVARPASKHFIVPTKDATIEVLADDLVVQRLPGPTSAAAIDALAFDEGRADQ
jgi:hypothetical protein